MKAVIGLLFVCLLFSCSQGNSKPSYLFKPASKPGLAAKAGDIEVTNAEVDADGTAVESFDFATKAFDVKFNKLRGLLLQKIMDKDPRKKNLSNDEFLNKYITKDVKVSDKEIDAFIEEEGIPEEHINPEVREKLRGYLQMERKKEAVDKWLAEMTKKTPVEVYLEKPRRPTYPVEPGSAPSFGDKDAKVTIIEFSDFQCPHCAKGAKILKQIKQKYGNKVRIAFRNFPLPFHTHAEAAAVAGLCANEQSTDIFWKLHDEMFANQDTLDAEGLKKLGKKVGVKMDAFEKCRADNKHLAQVKADMEEGKKNDVRSTPTFFVNGQVIQGAHPMAVFSEIIDEEMAR